MSINTGYSVGGTRYSPEVIFDVDNVCLYKGKIYMRF